MPPPPLLEESTIESTDESLMLRPIEPEFDTESQTNSYYSTQQDYTHTKDSTLYDRVPFDCSPLPVGDSEYAEESNVTHSQDEDDFTRHVSDTATASATVTATSIASIRGVMEQNAATAIEMTEMEESMQQQSNDAIIQLTFTSSSSETRDEPVGVIWHSGDISPGVTSTHSSSLMGFIDRLAISTLLARYVPDRVLGISYLALSAVIFSIQSLFVSILSDHLPSFQIVMFRCILQFSFGVMACHHKGINFLGPVDRRKWLFIRGLVGFVSFSLYYYAMSQLTLADATTIFFTAPLYTGLLGFLFLGESVARFDIGCTIMSIVGVVMVVRPAFLFGSEPSSNGVGVVDGNGTVDADDPSVNIGADRAAGVIAAIAGSLSSACVYIAIRKVGPGVPPLVLVAYMGMCGVFFAPFGGIFQTFTWPSEFKIWFFLLLVGIFSFIGQVLFNAGVQREKAGPASMIRNLDVAFSFLWQITIEGIPPDVWSVFGALIISASVVAMGIKKWRSETTKPTVSPATTVPSPLPSPSLSLSSPPTTTVSLRPVNDAGFTESSASFDDNFDREHQQGHDIALDSSNPFLRGSLASESNGTAQRI